MEILYKTYEPLILANSKLSGGIDLDLKQYLTEVFLNFILDYSIYRNNDEIDQAIFTKILKSRLYSRRINYLDKLLDQKKKEVLSLLEDDLFNDMIDPGTENIFEEVLPLEDLLSDQGLILALKKLIELQRTIVLKRIVEDKNDLQIALELNLSLENVKKHYQRSIKKLQKEYKHKKK